MRLTHSYRMDASDPAGRSILKVAQAVHRGRLSQVLREGRAPKYQGDDATPAQKAPSTKASFTARHQISSTPAALNAAAWAI